MIMKLFTLLLLVTIATANAETITADGRFKSSDDDSVTFIKKQLLQNAFQSAFTKELRSMGLDDKLFWENYDAKFSEEFSKTKKSLGIKMKVLDADGVPLENVPYKTKESYKQRLRLKRLNKKLSFGNFDRIISKYSIRKMARSPKYPNSRYIKINANVDRKEVHNLYLKFTSVSESTNYSKVYLSTNFYLKSMSWSDTGVELESDFTDVVRRHWKEKLEMALEGIAQEVVLCDSVMESKLKSFGLLPAKVRGKLLAGGQKEAEADVDNKNELKNTLWMNIDIYISKVNDEADTKKRTFSLSEEMVLVDVYTNKVLSFYDPDDSNLTVSYEEPKGLSSSVAGFTYQLILPSFKTLTSDISKKGGVTKNTQITVSGKANMADILKLKNKLLEVGITHNFQPKIVKLSKEGTIIDLFYSGLRDDILLTLSKIDGFELSKDKIVRVENNVDRIVFSVSK